MFDKVLNTHFKQIKINLAKWVEDVNDKDKWLPEEEKITEKKKHWIISANYIMTQSECKYDGKVLTPIHALGNSLTTLDNVIDLKVNFCSIWKLSRRGTRHKTIELCHAL